MSDNYLRLVPSDPALVPSKEVATTFVNLVGNALPDAHEVLAESYGHPVFIDQGANLESIICPSCETTLPLDSESNRDWWYEVSDDLENEDIRAVEVCMPCCGVVVPFEQLRFDWPAAVASFEISILNPNVRALPVDLLAELERALGCEIKQVWAHY